MWLTEDLKVLCLGDMAAEDLIIREFILVLEHYVIISRKLQIFDYVPIHRFVLVIVIGKDSDVFVEAHRIKLGITSESKF